MNVVFGEIYDYEYEGVTCKAEMKFELQVSVLELHFDGTCGRLEQKIVNRFIEATPMQVIKAITQCIALIGRSCRTKTDMITYAEQHQASLKSMEGRYIAHMYACCALLKIWQPSHEQPQPSYPLIDFLELPLYREDPAARKALIEWLV